MLNKYQFTYVGKDKDGWYDWKLTVNEVTYSYSTKDSDPLSVFVKLKTIADRGDNPRWGDSITVHCNE